MRQGTSGSHVVLGARGAVGAAVVAELLARDLPVVVAGRTQVDAALPFVPADLDDAEATARAVAGAATVYLCVGLPYRNRTWQVEWPRIMRNVVDGAAAAGARVVFLDNVYMYGPPPLSVPFDETEPQRPATVKGRVRREIAGMLLEAHARGRIQALIGRSADFYGPGARTSFVYSGFLERMLRGRAPQWLGRRGARHTFAYTGDVGRALVTLGLDETAYGRAWHLPVGDPVTIEDFAAVANHVLGTDHAVSYIPRPLVRPLSLLIPALGAAREMLYQFDQDYVMSFEAFRRVHPDFRVTTYEDGLALTLRSFQGSAS